MATTRDHGALPQTLGVPGSSLTGEQSWVVNDEVRKAGKRGEEKTARAIALVCVPGGPTVLHSLRLPMPGVDADIDHVVVAGRDLFIVDSKVWRPSRYWTLAHTTRRGLERVPFADKHTSEMAVRALRSLLAARQVDVVIHEPLIVVWSSNTSRAMKLGLYRPRGAHAIAGEVFEHRVGSLFRHAPADPAVVNALYPLLGTARGAQPGVATGAPPPAFTVTRPPRPGARSTFVADEF
ncbi:MAG: nuclease-related domain-containing protein [Acidimicrobiales bacterium]